jgi:iron complex transport system substrate-binding protein
MVTGMRIVSLIASSTEIVCALGFGGDLVARSHECDYPDFVRALPAVTGPKFAVTGTSRQIDERVKVILEEGLSVYRVDAAALDALAPDVIVTQAQCAVCAVSLADVEEAARCFVRSRPRVVSLEPNALADVWADIERVAEALGAPERGRALVAGLRGRVDAIAERARARPPRRVAVIEWIDPLMTAGNWMPELCALAGGVSLFGEAGKHSPYLSWEALCAADPEVIVVTPCGFELARTRAELPVLAALPGYDRLAARVVLADGNAFMNRPGPRLVESLEILAEILHPELFAFGHEGTGWERAAL